jgi:hypothetical protein
MTWKAVLTTSMNHIDGAMSESATRRKVNARPAPKGDGGVIEIDVDLQQSRMGIAHAVMSRRRRRDDDGEERLAERDRQVHISMTEATLIQQRLRIVMPVGSVLSLLYRGAGTLDHRAMIDLYELDQLFSA